MKIIDSTGTGLGVKVNAENRLMGSSVTSTEKVHNVDKGNGYNVNTGCITLTSAAKTTVLYIKNDSDCPLFLTSFIYNLGATTCGSGDVVIDINKNPTTGCIICNANDVDINVNQNFGSSLAFTGLAYKGATGETATNGTRAVSTRSVSNTGRIVVDLGAVVLLKGSTISIDYTPPAGNTSQVVQFAVSVFFQNIVV